MSEWKGRQQERKNERMKRSEEKKISTYSPSSSKLQTTIEFFIIFQHVKIIFISELVLIFLIICTFIFAFACISTVPSIVYICMFLR